MATNKQRRDSERARLQRQLEERRQKEAARKRFTLIGSIVGTLVIIVAVVVIVVVATGGKDDKKNNDAGGDTGSSAPASPTASSSAAAPCTTSGLPGVVDFQGVSVGNAANLKKEPKVCSTSATAPAKLQVKDLVVGKGTAASAKSSVSVQYTGVLYKNGTQFDSSWSRGQAADFSLQQVVPGFTQGIGGTTGVKPMKVGGRRIIIMPAALGYGSQANNGIPANSPLVFVVDLVKVS